MYTFTAELWLYEGADPWHFVTVPAGVADEIRISTGDQAKAFGTVPVDACVGGTRWSTSLFPEGTSGNYVLPVKKSVRLAEDLEDGDEITIQVVVRRS